MHQFHSSLLREYDVRGVVGETLSEDDAYALGRSFGSIVARAGGRAVATGYDGRLSSPALEAAVARGLGDCGLTVHRTGLGPTPMLYFAVYHLSVDGGIMITGSHNPPDYNGFKMMRAGKPFFGEDIQALGRIAARGDWVPEEEGRLEAVDLKEAYIARIAGDYDAPRGLKVAWDCGNGAAGAVLGRLLERLPGEHVSLFEEVDGNFPNHHPDPTVEANLEDLRRAVVDGGCDLGIGFDGDGDRIGVIDGQGRVLWGDQILVVLARDVLKDHPGATVIADVKASQVLFDEIARAGGSPLMFRTGHSLIKNKMAETGAPLAGEMSGHIFFADRYYGFDDALYVAVRFLDVIARGEETVAAIRDALPRVCNTPEIRFDCEDERKFAVIEEVKARLRAEGAAVNDVDGVRVSTPDGWWLLRASNTQPVLVARCEAGDEAGLERLKGQVAGALAAVGLTPPVDF